MEDEPPWNCIEWTVGSAVTMGLAIVTGCCWEGIVLRGSVLMTMGAAAVEVMVCGCCCWA